MKHQLKIPLSLWVWMGLCFMYILEVAIMGTPSPPPVLMQWLGMILILYPVIAVSGIAIKFPWKPKEHIHSEKCKHNHKEKNEQRYL